MMRIALLTDFGSRDHYAAAMKGVIARGCDAAIIDLSHEILPQDIFGGAYFLKCSVPSFEGSGTIIVAVVDPGVGSARRILAARQRGLTFLAPDNGLLSMVLDDDAKIRSVENESHFLPAESATFHGRDRFAPLAAAIAGGTEIESLGPELRREDLIALDYSPPAFDNEVFRGMVVLVDRFGNLVTDLEMSKLGPPGTFELRIGMNRISRFARTYEDGGEEPFLIAGSSGTLEVSIRNGRAAEVLHSARFDTVEASLVEGG